MQSSRTGYVVTWDDVSWAALPSGTPHRLGTPDNMTRGIPATERGTSKILSFCCFPEFTFTVLPLEGHVYDQESQWNAGLSSSHWGNGESCKTLQGFSWCPQACSATSGKVPETPARVRNSVPFCRNSVWSCYKDTSTVSVFRLNNIYVSQTVRIFLQSQISPTVPTDTGPLFPKYLSRL